MDAANVIRNQERHYISHQDNKHHDDSMITDYLHSGLVKEASNNM